MEYEVLISERAKTRLEKIFEYLEQNWSEKVKKDFKEKLLNNVDFLRQNPLMYPESQVKKGLRMCLITKHNAMYYRVLNNTVEIITIHDTRSNPKSLNL